MCVWKFASLKNCFCSHFEWVVLCFFLFHPLSLCLAGFSFLLSVFFPSQLLCIPFLSSKRGMCRMVFIFPFVVVVVMLFFLSSCVLSSLLLLLLLSVVLLVVRSFSYMYCPFSSIPHPLYLQFVVHTVLCTVFWYSFLLLAMVMLRCCCHCRCRLGNTHSQGNEKYAKH